VTGNPEIGGCAPDRFAPISSGQAQGHFLTPNARVRAHKIGLLQSLFVGTDATCLTRNMSNLHRLKQAFAEALDSSADGINAELAYGSSGWDSLAHMVLVANIEREFDIMLDTDDVVGMSGFSKAKEIVARHGIAFEPD
jgi:acyl carrier protein